MKKVFISLLIVFIVFRSDVNSQGGNLTLDVVSWNLEWFGSASNGPGDENLQEANAKKVLRWLNADLYGMVEIVDTMRFRRLVDSLDNTQFGYVIAPYCTQATTPTGGAWLNGQKQAFIYRKSVFTNVTTRGMMRNSANANVNFASGRFPFMLSATVTVNGVSRNMNFIVLHAKAGDTNDDYNKRLGGAIELKDTLDLYYSTTTNLIIGDFNDALHTSIYTGASLSSYYPFVQDSTDSDHYKSITLPLGVAGQSSMINFPNVIDNHIISNEAFPFYVQPSAQIKTDVTTVVPDYVTAHNTSDHYPVFSSYNLSGFVTGLPTVEASVLGINLYPNPSSSELFATASKNISGVKMQLVDMNGKVISTYSYGLITTGSTVTPKLPLLSQGVYFMIVETKQYRSVVKLMRF